ncbi:hypothetical protein ACOMHN_014604 [Nucella lapillus]
MGDGGPSRPSAEAIAEATAAASSTNTMMTNSQFSMAPMEGPKLLMGDGGNMPKNMGPHMPGNMAGNMNMGGNMRGNMNNMGGNMGGNMNNMGGNMGGNPNMGSNMGGGNMPNMGGNMVGNMGNMPNMGGGMVGPMGPMGPNMMMGPMNLGQFAAGLLGSMGPLGMIGPGPEGMNMGMMHTQGPMGAPVPQKEVITFSSCVLLPPHPEAPQHSVRDRPPGCRTAFVGCQPENVTKEILQEIFEKFGPIEFIRLGKKNFAHIRFIKPESVEEAMSLSGYRMKIDNKDDKPNTGRINVDYANARNDQYEFESDSGFMKACQQLVTWLDRGSVDKRSANLFYSLVQSLNSHVRRLQTEKQQHEEELNQAKLLFKQRVQGIIVQLGQIESVFTSTLKQRNWDHFTRAQRKNVDTWYKLVKDIQQAQQAQFLDERNEMEMDMSDTEAEDKEPTPKRKRKDRTFDGVAASEAADQLMSSSQLHTLKEENDSLKCQLKAYINEAEIVKLESKQTIDEMEKRITALQNALKGMQQQLITHQAQARAAENKSPATEKRKSSSDSFNPEDASKDTEATEGEKARPGAHSQDSSVSSSGIPLTEKEARILGLICCFLNGHPSGATVDYLWSYLSQFVGKIRPREIEDLLDRLPTLFQQELAGVGASLERRWCFIGYKKEAA